MGGSIIRSSWDGYTTLTASRISSQHQHRQTKQSAKSINIPSVTTSHISSHSHRRASIEYQRAKKSIKGATFEPGPKHPHHTAKQQHRERKTVCVSHHSPPPHFPFPRPAHKLHTNHAQDQLNPNQQPGTTMEQGVHPEKGANHQTDNTTQTTQRGDKSQHNTTQG